MTKRLRLAGRHFGFLTVVEQAGTTRDARQHKKASLWRCRCICGEEVVVRADHLRCGRVKACAVNGHRWNLAVFCDYRSRFEVKA